MDRAYEEADRTAAEWKNRRLRLRLECRECEVVCERVVSPWHCLRSGCAYVYAYEDSETTYFGCLHKVFAPELDLASFTGPSARLEVGGVRRARGRSDPYGSLRATRSPLSHCRVTVEQAYSSDLGRGGCCNPTFFHHPAAPHDDGIRLIAKSRPGHEPGVED